MLEFMHNEAVAEAGTSERFLSEFDKFKGGFLAPARDVIFVINAMCSFMPICVGLDLEFVRRAFVLEEQLARIRSDSSYSEGERERRLHEWSVSVVSFGFDNALGQVKLTDLFRRDQDTDPTVMTGLSSPLLSRPGNRRPSLHRWGIRGRRLGRVAGVAVEPFLKRMHGISVKFSRSSRGRLLSIKKAQHLSKFATCA